MASINYYLDTRRTKNDGRYPIKFRVQHIGKFLISSGFDATIESWGGNEYTKGEPNYRSKNAALRKMFVTLEEELLLLQSSGQLPAMTDKMLKTHLESPIKGGDRVAPQKKFIDYLDDFVSLKTNEGTKSVYAVTRNKIAAYDSTCTFETMDRKWLSAFEAWMQKTGMKINAYAIHLRNIRAVFNYALDEEITTLYPFRKFKIKKEETRKRCLTVDQLRTLRDYPCEEHQVRYRDIFMLMFYLIGVNASDLFMARKSDVVNGRLEYKRHKTGKLYSVRIEPEAQAIIDRYAGSEANGYLLNVMDSYGDYKNFLSIMDFALKQIGDVKRKGRGGKKERTPLFPDLSSYWSRHTWATIAAELDVPIETISRALGHETGAKVTNIYIRFDLHKVDMANRRVIDYVNGL